MPASSANAQPRLLGRARRGAGHAGRLLAVAVRRLLDHHGTQLAASISYYALFSLFPAAIVAAAIAGVVLDDPGARADAVEFLVDELPVSGDQGRSDIEGLIDGVTRNSGTLGVIGVLVLLVSASALMSAARNSIGIVFGVEERRGALRGKLLDILLIVAIGALISLSFAATLLSRLDVSLGGALGDAIEGALGASGVLVALGLTAAVFAILYTVLPVGRRSLREVWPGLAFATIGYELLKLGFSFYLDNFADYSAVYGSLGAVIAFMFFIYLAGIVFLLGAEMAAAWPAVRAGELDPDPAERDDRPFREKLLDAGRRLFARGDTGRDDGERR